MNSRKISIFSGILSLVLVILACTFNIGGPSYPTPPILVSTEAVGELKSSLETAVAAGAQSGQITLTLTESQLTSYLSYKLLGQPHPLFYNPQVYLRAGQLKIYGTVKKGYFQATARIIFNAAIDNQGKLSIELYSADFGPLPIPNGFKEIVTATIQEAYSGALGPIATGFRLQSIMIEDGTMQIIGLIK